MESASCVTKKCRAPFGLSGNRQWSPMSVVNSARAAALEVLLAHFPNVPFTMLGIEETYGPDTVRALPGALNLLREELQADLRRQTALADTIDTAIR